MAQPALVGYVAFSPDGKRIAIGDDSSIATVWDAATGRKLLRLKGHTAAIDSIAFFLGRQRIVTGSMDRTARVWDVNSGHELLRITAQKAAINAVAFSPDGRRILGWSLAPPDSGMPRTATNCARSQATPIKFRTSAFSPDGQRIVTKPRSKGHSMDVSDGHALNLLEHSLAVECVAFSQDGQLIITGCVDQTAKVWNADSGRLLLTLKGHSAGVDAVAFSLTVNLPSPGAKIERSSCGM